MVSEPAYYFTNLVSAKSFIVQLDAKSLSMDEIEFEESMQAAKLDSKVSQLEASQAQTDPIPSTRMHGMKSKIDGKIENCQVVAFMCRFFSLCYFLMAKQLLHWF